MGRQVTNRLSFDEARRRAMFRELEADPTIVLFGGDPARRRSPEYESRFGDRILHPPLSEFSYSAVAVGAAIAGLRPFVSVHTSSFIFYGWSAIVNEAANVRYLSGGKANAPVVFSIIAGSRGGGGPQHQHTPQAMIQNIPGLRIFAPGTPAEIDSVIHEALTGKDPTIMIEHSFLDGDGDVEDEPIRLENLVSVREGSDVAIVAYSYMTVLSLASAIALENEGISAAVFSVPVLAPSPVASIIDALRGFRGIVFVDESRGPGSPASYWMACLGEMRPAEVRTRLVCSRFVPSPQAPHLCKAVEPSSVDIANAVRELIAAS